MDGSTYKIFRRTPHLWDPILSFSHTFSPKSTCIGGPCPTKTGPRPLREILDPLLIITCSFCEDKKQSLLEYSMYFRLSAHSLFSVLICFSLNSHMEKKMSVWKFFLGTTLPIISLQICQSMDTSQFPILSIFISPAVFFARS